MNTSWARTLGQQVPCVDLRHSSDHKSRHTTCKMSKDGSGLTVMQGILAHMGLVDLACFIFSLIISGWAQLGHIVLAAVAAGSWGYCHERFEEADQSLVDEKFYTSTSFLS